MLLGSGVSSRQESEGLSSEHRQAILLPESIWGLLSHSLRRKHPVPGADSVLPGSVLDHTDDIMTARTTTQYVDSECEVTSLVLSL